uniref:Ribosomal RNA-processing protein 43 n=1 Tax=Acrobeloides nanus TaxID=290746 RepID=A0A914E4M2_9BILA
METTDSNLLSLASGELLKKFDPQKYFDQFLSEGVYPDGRPVSQFRESNVKTSVDRESDGSSYVQQGGACVSCTVNLSVAISSSEPGVLFTIESLGSVSEDLITDAQNFLDRLLSKNVFFDISQLDAGHNLRWTLHLKIMVLSSDGFIMDALLTAVNAAFMDTKFPSVFYPEITEEDATIDLSKVKINREKISRLTLKDTPVYSVYVLYNSWNAADVDECIVLCDPNKEICELTQNRCEIIIGKNDLIYEMSYAGKSALTETILSEIMICAKRRYGKISEGLNKIRAR